MAGKLSHKEKRGICGICSAGCWVVAEYDEKGRIVKVRPDEESEMGILCKLGEHSPDIIYSENRLRYPMKRKGPKGTYEFERISWDEALDTIADRLGEIKTDCGAEATAIYTGVGTFELAYCDVFQPKDVMVSSASSVLFPFGSPNTMGVGALCYVSYGMIAPHVTFGSILNNMFNDMENSDLIVVWGANPATDLPPVDMRRILAANRRGAEVVVIDPRRTETVKLTNADWIPVRPGTDGALALGMCNVLIREELYDEPFVRDWTKGFDEFDSYVQHYRPEVVEEITGVPAETVVTLARKLAFSRGASQLMYTGMEFSNSGLQSIRATQVLWALAGQLDVPGGSCFMMPGNNFPINREGLIKNPDTGIRIGKDRFPVYVRYRDEAHAIDLPRSVLEEKPYKIRGLIIQGGSIVTAWPQPEVWKKTLNALDFLVCIDRQLTADSAYADIVLPATTHYEIESYMVYGSLFRIRERMIEPMGEARSDFFILAELADRLGYGHLYPQTEREMFDYVLKGSGFTYDDVKAAGGTVSVETDMMQYRKWEKGLLRSDGQPGFETPSGKFEIASGILEEYGYDSLPVFTPPAEGPRTRPDLAEHYPLIFNSGARLRTSFHTQHHGIGSLNRHRPEPSVILNSSDAEVRGIENGDKVRIKTVRGAVCMRARVTDDIAPGSIDANHACGGPVGPEAWQQTNVNDLTDLDQYDPISGFPVYKCLLCEVEKADAEDRLEIGSEDLTADEIPIGSQHQTQAEEPIYLDHNATTPMDPEVRDAVTQAMEVYGNPSSIHSRGISAGKILDEARRKTAGALGCTVRRLVFTGGGTEAVNLAIKGALACCDKKRNHIITSVIEHPAVLNTCRWLESGGYRVTYLGVDQTGRVRPADLEAAISGQTALVSIMTANNETGTIQPVSELAEIARDRGALFHTDAVQAFGKIPIYLEGIDLLSVSAHKVYGPKGVGALYIAKGVDMEPLVHGGGQEFGLRSGTENLPGIAGFARAAERIPETLSDAKRFQDLRDRLWTGIGTIIRDCRLNGHPRHRLPNTLNITLPGFRGESVVLEMARHGICFSSGSACHSGSSEPSHALLAMGLSKEEAHCALRFSLGRHNTRDEVERVLKKLEKTLTESKNIVHFVPCR
ncbi:MAG: IscS subfamily cysteine desulfurase [Desulfobacteraceae bacterium]|nr:IscS subfamily cysteine desulfurase [Desulfobacteraceae bacterium]